MSKNESNDRIREYNRKSKERQHQVRIIDSIKEKVSRTRRGEKIEYTSEEYLFLMELRLEIENLPD